MPYTCRRCLITQARALCPGCLEFMSDDVEVCEAAMERLDPPSNPILWCTAFGHWGDTFVCVGQMLRFLKLAGQRQCNVLYAGPDLQIAEWLRAQSFVREVIGVPVTSTQYRAFWERSIRPGCTVESWLPALQGCGVALPDAGEITQTQVNTHWFHHVPAELWHCGRLPESARARAGELYPQMTPQGYPQISQMGESDLTQRGQGAKRRKEEEVSTRRVIHVHPVSTWSETAANHWAHWRVAIYWLLLQTPHIYVMTGQQAIPGLPKHDRLIDLVGQTKSNAEVLAVSELCDGVISTPNNVALWSVIQKQRALVVGNAASRPMSSYYRRFLERGERMEYLSVDISWEAFVKRAERWLEW